jgi:hypothetical protein
VAAAFDGTVVSCFMETRERSPLLLESARAAGNSTTNTSSDQIDFSNPDLHFYSGTNKGGTLLGLAKSQQSVKTIVVSPNWFVS